MDTFLTENVLSAPDKASILSQLGVTLGTAAGDVPVLGSGGKLPSSMLSAVVYDSPLSLTATQKIQARNNIGAPTSLFAIIGSFSAPPSTASVVGGTIYCLQDIAGRNWWGLTLGTTSFSIGSDYSYADTHTVLDFSGLPLLTSISLANTLITTPPVVTGLSALQTLNLQGSHITSYPALTGLTALTTLNLSSCASMTSSAMDTLYSSTSLGSLYYLLTTGGSVAIGSCNTSGGSVHATAASVSARGIISGAHGWTLAI